MLRWRTARPYARWIAAALILVASAWPAMFAAGHYWAAGGPPTPEPYRTWHENWGNVSPRQRSLCGPPLVLRSGSCGHDGDRSSRPETVRFEWALVFRIACRITTRCS